MSQVKDGCILFGKHKGAKVDSLPFGYIHFLLHKGGKPPLEAGLVSMLEKRYDEFLKQYKDDPSIIVLDFGKYSGSALSEIPLDYIRWLVDQDWFCENPLSEFVEEYLEGERE